MLRISLHSYVLLLIGLVSLLVQGLPSSDANLGQPQTVQVAQLASPSPAVKLELTVAKNNETALQPNVTQNNATQVLAPVPSLTTSVLGQVNDDPANPPQNETSPSTTPAPSPSPSTSTAVTTESSNSAATSEASTSAETIETTTSTSTSQATESSNSTTISTTAVTASSSTSETEATAKVETETTTTTNAPPEQSPQAAEQPEGMSSGIIAVVMAIVFAIVVVIVYAGLLLWRRYLEFRYGNRELLVNDLEFDTNDLRHFEL